jgi:hypothetical protein
LGPDFHVVASTGNILVEQSASTGVVDFLTLGAGGALVSSTMSGAVPRIAGFALDIGQTLVSQLPDGELDFLKYNSAGTLVASDLLANTVGLPNAVGVSAFALTGFSAFNGVGSTDVVETQLADGSLDLIGFSGTFGTTLAYSASNLLAGSAGTEPIGAVNQNNGSNFNVLALPSTIEGLQLIGQTASGQPDVLYYDTGINDPANTGIRYATNLLNDSFPGWNVVDGGGINHTLIFPVS